MPNAWRINVHLAASGIPFYKCLVEKKVTREMTLETAYYILAGVALVCVVLDYLISVS